MLTPIFTLNLLMLWAKEWVRGVYSLWVAKVTLLSERSRYNRSDVF